MRKGFATFLLLVLAASAHGAGTPREAFEAARGKWIASNIRTYEFQIQQSCFCLGLNTRGPAHVKVVKGKIRSVRYTKPVGSAEQRKVPADSGLRTTILELFEQIDLAYRSGFDTIEVSFDPKYGYPIAVTLDSSAHLTDNDVTFVISEFRQ